MSQQPNTPAPHDTIKDHFVTDSDLPEGITVAQLLEFCDAQKLRFFALGTKQCPTVPLGYDDRTVFRGICGNYVAGSTPLYQTIAFSFVKQWLADTSKSYADLQKAKAAKLAEAAQLLLDSDHFKHNDGFVMASAMRSLQSYEADTSRIVEGDVLGTLRTALRAVIQAAR